MRVCFFLFSCFFILLHRVVVNAATPTTGTAALAPVVNLCVPLTSPVNFTIPNDPSVLFGNKDGVYGKASWTFTHDTDADTFINNVINIVLCSIKTRSDLPNVNVPDVVNTVELTIPNLSEQRITYSKIKSLSQGSTFFELSPQNGCWYGTWTSSSLIPAQRALVQPQLWFRNLATGLIAARMYTDAPENLLESTLVKPPTTAPPTTAAPVTTQSPTTPTPTTPAPTTQTPTTQTPTTQLPTTAAPTTQAPTTAPDLTITVGLTNGVLSFTPSNPTIITGQTIQWTWINTVTLHTVTSGSSGIANGQFCSLPNSNSVQNTTTCSAVNYGQSSPYTWRKTFSSVGTFSYFCLYHPSTMTGSITVISPTTTPPITTQPPTTQTPATQAPTTVTPTTSAPTTPAPTGYAAEVHVIPLGGQSNMVGFGSGIDLALDGVNSSVFQLGQWNTDAGAIIPASEPLQHELLPHPQWDQVGMALTFAKQYIASRPGVIVLLVPSAQGCNTSFIEGNWERGGFLYNNLVARTNLAMGKVTLQWTNRVAKLVGILWHQGESDVVAADVYIPGHLNNLDDLIHGFRADITGATPTTPFILGDFVPDWIPNDERRIAMSSVFSSIPRMIYGIRAVNTTNEGLVGDPVFQVINFSAASQRKLGKLYYNAHVNITNSTVAPSTLLAQVQGLAVVSYGSFVYVSWTRLNLASSYNITCKLTSNSTVVSKTTTKFNQPYAIVTGLDTTATSYTFDVIGVIAGFASSSVVASVTLAQTTNSLLLSGLPIPSWRLEFNAGGVTNTGSDSSLNVSFVPGTSTVTYPFDSTQNRFVMDRSGSTNGYFRVSSRLAPSYTETFWVKTASTSSQIVMGHELLSANGEPSKEHYAMIENLRVIAGSQPRVVSTCFNTTIPRGIMARQLDQIGSDQWTFVAITYDNSTNRISIYVNGQFKVFKQTETVRLPYYNVTVGCGIDTVNSQYKCIQGRIDLPSFYPSVLTPGDIYAIYTISPPSIIEYHVFAMGGQSNMAGWSNPYDPLIDTTNPNILQLGCIGAQNNKIFLAAIPLQNQDDMLTATGGTYVGPGMTFAKRYLAANPNITVVLVGAAVGSTQIHNGRWEAGDGSLFLRLIARSNTAMNMLGSAAKFKGIIWHQGEGDVYDDNVLPGEITGMFKDSYYESLEDIIYGFKTKIKGASLLTPFINGDFEPHYLLDSYNGNEIRKANALIQQRIYATRQAVPLASFQSDPVTNTAHFDAPSIRIYGTIYGDRMLDVLGNSSTYPAFVDKVTNVSVVTYGSFAVVSWTRTNFSNGYKVVCTNSSSSIVVNVVKVDYIQQYAIINGLNTTTTSYTYNVSALLGPNVTSEYNTTVTSQASGPIGLLDPKPVWRLDFANGYENTGADKSVQIGLLFGTATLSYPFDTIRKRTVVERFAPSSSNTGGYFTVQSNLPANYSQTIWVYPYASTGSHQHLISDDDTTYGPEHSFLINENLRPFAGPFSQGTPYVPAMPHGYMVRGVESIPLNKWTHLAITFDSGSFNNVLRLYVNGRLTKFKYPARQPPVNYRQCTVGGHKGSNGLHGKFDLPSVYNYPLTAAEVFAIYTAQVA